jgi:soluble lytic murein transglycosylase-like protein
VAEVTEEIAPRQPVKTHETLSRGGTPLKPPSQRDMINMYVRDITSKYNMDPELIMSVIQQESEYNPRAKNGNCLGLMQVSSYWHKERVAKLGVTDFYDPYSNILIGVDYLSELYSQYKDMRLVLMLYNMEHNTALRMYRNGQISYYARTIITRAENYKKGE